MPARATVEQQASKQQQLDMQAVAAKQRGIGSDERGSKMFPLSVR
jgi:hypothetical protein